MKTSGDMFRKGWLQFVLIFISSVATVPTVTADPPPRPANLNSFVNVNNYASLEEAIANESYIYLPPGNYYVDAPITINRDTPLYIFGSGCGQATRIYWEDADQPLFIVNKAPRIGVYGLRIHDGSGNNSLSAFTFSNTEHVQFEMQDSEIKGAVIKIYGPVTAVLQQVNISNLSAIGGDGILLNHPDAEVYLLNCGFLYHMHHVKVEQGHLEVYGGSTGFHDPGRADFVIKNPSPKGEHILAGVRSEGTKSASASKLLHVKTSTNEAISVLVKSCSLSCGQSVAGPMVTFEGSGNLWLIGSQAICSDELVEGNSPNATVVALGNCSWAGGDDVLPIASSGATVYSYLNIYSYKDYSGDTTPPYRRFTPTIGNINSIPTIPNLPVNGVIPKLDRPVINSAPAGMLTSVTAYGAVPNDGLDDTAAIQQAINSAGPFLYFPAGTYNINQKLSLMNVSGGLIAGAGSASTKIVSTANGVFLTDGMARTTFQGMTFEVSQKYASTNDSVFSIELVNGTVAPTHNSFYDVVFDGSRHGISMSASGGTNCSETMIVDCVFKNSHMGLAAGDWNSHNEIIHGCTFTDNDYNLGVVDGMPGGSFHVLSATSTGTRQGMIKKIPAVGITYINKMTTDGPQIVDVGLSSAVKFMMFDQCTFTSASPNTPYLKWRTGGGPTFINSSTSSGELNLQNNQYAERYVMSIYSSIANWSTVLLDSDSLKYQVP